MKSFSQSFFVKDRRLKTLVVMTMVITGLLCLLGEESIVRAKTVVNVAKHRVKGSGVTAEDLEREFRCIKETWDSDNIEHVQVGGVDEVNSVNEGRVPGAVNIYGTNLQPKSPAGNAGKCHNRSYIEKGPNCPNDTLAHEIMHWGDAYPDNSITDEHGIPKGTYPGYPAYSGYDTDGDCDCDADDQDNISFPGKKRKGNQVDPNQRKRYEENMKKWLESQKAIEGGRGKDCNDGVGDAQYSFIDITDTSSWGLGTSKIDYMLYFKMLLVEFPDFYDPPVMLGFYLETDQTYQTGEPPEGLDYFVSYDSMTQKVLLWKYEHGLGWIHLPIGIAHAAVEYVEFDEPLPPEPIGLTFSLPLAALQQGINDVLSYRAIAIETVGGWVDIVPDIGLAAILTKPLPPEGIAGDLDNDGDVDFKDFAIFADNWLVGTELSGG